MKTLILVSLLSPQDGGVRISIQTRDGNAVTGITDVGSISLESSLGKTVFPLKHINTIWFSKDRASVGTSDGTTLTGKISQTSWTVKTRLGEFTIKSEDIHTISVLGVAAPPPAPAPPSPRPGAAGQPSPPSKPPTNPGLTPSKILKLGTVVTRALRTPDGKKLLLLDAADSRVVVADLQNMEREREIPLAGGETAMSVAPGGGRSGGGGAADDHGPLDLPGQGPEDLPH